ncbi:MAG: hypothetical protein DRP70_10525 [Spirochaetes bacterium]|nr:MAG: hypothetical protein DRP70_10525 [Spirochaetota bacterium]
MRLLFKFENFKTSILFLLFLSAFTAMSWAEIDDQDLLTIEQLQEQQKEASGNVALEEIYTEAIDAMEKAEEYRLLKDEYKKALLLTDQTRTSLLRELDVPVVSPVVDFPDSMNVDQAEDELERERARYFANQTELHDQQILVDNMLGNRSNISQQLGELDLQIDLLNRGLRAQDISVETADVKNANKLNIIARRTAAESEIEMLRARLDLLTAKSRYAPLIIDLAKRRVDYSQELVDIYKKQAVILRDEEAMESLRLVGELSKKLSEEFPVLSEFTSETEQLAQNLWGPAGIIARSEQTTQNLSEVNNNLNQLRRITELTLRKFNTYGNRGNVNRWWPDIPETFPDRGEAAASINKLGKLIPEIDHQMITLAQKRGQTYDYNRKTLDLIRKSIDGDFSPEMEQRVRQYFTVRQDLLDQLIQKGGIYENQLVEFQEMEKNFLKQLNDVQSFLYSHVLWSRSVPKPILPRFRDVTAAAGWVFSLNHWKNLNFSDNDKKPGVVLLLLVIILLIIIRIKLFKRLEYIAEIVSNPEKDTFFQTFRALVITLLLVLPLPGVMILLGKITGILGSSLYWYAASDAFSLMALITILLETTRLIFIRRGLAEVHFHWPVQVTRSLSRGLFLTEFMSLPFLYLSLLLMFSGGRLDSRETYQVFNNSLGRIAFIIALLIIGLGLLLLIKPEKSEKLSSDYTRVPWPRRLSAYAFPTAYLGAYPLIIFFTLVPVILAIAGYYLTGMLLAFQMLRTLILLLFILLGSGVLRKFGNLAQQDNDKQTRGMYKFFMVMVISIGVFSIWSEAIPMLQFLKRVQILPRIQMIEEPSSSSLTLDIFGEPEPENQNSPSDTGSEPAVDSVTTLSADTTVAAAAGTGNTPLTLWMITVAMIAAGIAVVVTRGLPGIVDIVLKRRTSVDYGARFAIGTLLKYSLTIIGTITVFNLLGLKWSQIQWLAAALTFGLGFGLQEIVANFVSGLILLIERPIRVDDVVTIGELMGRVSRIQIRATTITLWDRSEMVVPNKEFITKKLVNWTLSDSKRRIDIPLRVVYGTNLDQVKMILVSCALENPLVLVDPEPHAIIIDFAKDAINFELRFVVDFGNGIQAKDEVQMAVDRKFKENGIFFAMPQLNVQLSREDESTRTPPVRPDAP